MFSIALEVFTEALAGEVDPKWNIRVRPNFSTLSYRFQYLSHQITVIEPGPFNTKVINENLVVLPPHPAYIDPNLGTNVSRKWMTPEKLHQIAGNVSKAASLFYRLSLLEDPPFRLPLHPRVLDKTKQRIQSLQAGVEHYGSWSEEIF